MDWGIEMRVKRSFGAMVATVAVSAVLAGCGGPVVGSGAGSGSGSGSDSGSSGDGGSESRDQGGPGVGAPKDKDGKVPKPPIKVTTTRFTRGVPSMTSCASWRSRSGSSAVTGRCA